ncbi:AzlC family ABC transporter permease [Zhihengliuella halotolerans]|uniref:Putative branched-subunit amino acid permease n=1 Tax=Zhihengliuella halotolerans TaxID=370736 RepID=A0A4Q8AGA3_9MICC|nr:AzlC family ABC transporter permease [Zhihengliuella halotolerans]RZU63390.1 putative branched-subunit amino acid permease [Zhihengliuella halotolerans]
MRLTFLTPAVRIALSVSVATGLYGISFGALSIAAGLDLWQTMALSALMFTGGSQFAFIGVLAGGGAGAAAFGAASLLGVRNAIYGMQMNVMLRPRKTRRLLAAHVTIDESIAVAAGQTELVEAKRGFWWTGFGVFALWNVFTVLGAVLGDALGDPAAWGLDGAAVAAFLALLWPRLKSRDPIALAVVAAVVTILAVPVVPSGVPIMIAAIVAGVWGWLGSGRMTTSADAETHPEGERA